MNFITTILMYVYNLRNIYILLFAENVKENVPERAVKRKKTLLPQK